MTETVKETIRRALQCYRSDDYERATAAFRGMTPEQLAQEYGHSGQTCQEILDGYKRHVDSVDEALFAVKCLP